MARDGREPSNATPSSSWRRQRDWLLGLLLLLALVVLGTPWFGPEFLWPNQISDAAEWEIFVRFRLTRLLLGLLAGASFAAAGCLFQAVLRNPLASPYTLGVSTGASLGAVVMILSGAGLVWAGSLLGGLTALAIVAGLGMGNRRLSANALVLAGISVNSVCAALIVLLQSVASFSQSFAVTTWLIGAMEAPALEPLGVYGLVTLPMLGWLVVKAPEWDLLTMGDAWAEGRGVAAKQLLWQACVVGSLLTAATVTLTGPIGFIGLVVPHMMRPLVGNGHRVLLPASAMAGAALLVLCDTVARSVLRPAEIPVGVVTALLGGPGLIWILRRRRSGQGSPGVEDDR